MSRQRKNIRFVPADLLTHISTFSGDAVIVACALEVRAGNIAKYEHLGLRLEHGNLIAPPPFIPNPAQGRFSRANSFGWSRPMRHLPKIRKAWDVESPNWGSNTETHTVTFVKRVYPREYFSAKEVIVKVDILKSTAAGWVVRFAVDEVISRSTPNFAHELYFNLNILQETIGDAHVFESSASLADYLPTVRVHWEILPVGTVREILARIREKFGSNAGDTLPQIQDRIAVLKSLNPDKVIIGTSTFSRYIGVLWDQGLAVFENARYGNALYVINEDWEILSQKTRLELMRTADERYQRIVHTGNWQDRLRRAVGKRLGRA